MLWTTCVYFPNQQSPLHVILKYRLVSVIQLVQIFCESTVLFYIGLYLNCDQVHTQKKRS